MNCLMSWLKTFSKGMIWFSSCTVLSRQQLTHTWGCLVKSKRNYRLHQNVMLTSQFCQSCSSMSKKSSFQLTCSIFTWEKLLKESMLCLQSLVLNALVFWATSAGFRSNLSLIWFPNWKRCAKRITGSSKASSWSCAPMHFYTSILKSLKGKILMERYRSCLLKTHAFQTMDSKKHHLQKELHFHLS